MDIQFVERPIEGLHRDLYIGQQDRIDELNTRITSRHFPDQTLRPNFDPRPVPTKYSLFPIIERRTQHSVPIQPVPVHKVSTNFNPATRTYPFSSYLENFNVELELRNQTTTLSKNDINVYVPSSSSELYQVRLPQSVGTGTHNHPGLFEKHQYASPLPDITTGKIGQSQMFNHTRTQLRNIQ